MAKRTRRKTKGSRRRGRKSLRGGNAHGLMAQLYKAAPALAMAAILSKSKSRRLKGGSRRRKRR